MSRRVYHSPQTDRFADLLAQGWAPRDAAREMGLSVKSGDNMMCELRKKLGWQAQ